MEIAKGKWEVSEKFYNQVKTDNGRGGLLTICTVYGSSRDQVEATAKLITEAGNVTNETGYSPRQLADQKQALLDACEKGLAEAQKWESLDECDCPSEGHICGLSRLKRSIKTMQAAIALATN